MTIAYNKIEIRIRLSAIRANYRLLCGHGSRVIGVVKADAYGHGLFPVAQALAQEGCDTFAIGSVEEGAALREELSRAGVKARIMSLLGPVDDADYPLLWEREVLPLIGSFRQLETLAGQAARRGSF